MTGNAEAWGSAAGGCGKSPVCLCLVYCGVCACMGETEFVGEACCPDHRLRASAVSQQQVPVRLLGDGKGQEDILSSNHLQYTIKGISNTSICHVFLNP